MSGAVIIRSCATINEALIVSGLLKDGGFDASVDNYHHASLEWWAIPAFGGVYVRVPEDQLFEAGQYMIDAVRSADERLTDATGALHTSPMKTRHLIAWSMLLLYSGVAYLILIPLGIALAWLIDAIIPASWLTPAGRPPAPSLPPVLPPQDALERCFYDLPQYGEACVIDFALFSPTVSKAGAQFPVITPEAIVFFGVIGSFLFFEFVYLSQQPKLPDLDQTP